MLEEVPFQIRRNEKTVKQFVDEIYTKYREDIRKLPCLTNEDKTTIDVICDGIISVLDYYDKNAMLDCYSTFFRMMEKAKKRLWRTHIGDTFSTDPAYYRIRTSTEGKEYSELDLLHCPFQRRECLSNERFSLAGFPSTYMSTMADLAWFETGLPKDFYLAKFVANPEFNLKGDLLYLDINPLWWCQKLKQEFLLMAKELVFGKYSSRAKGREKVSGQMVQK